MKLLMLKGLPASGKSTHAKELVAQGGWTRVNKDELRGMLHSGKWTKGNESETINARDAIIHTALDRGYSVVVDDTNFSPKHEARLMQLAEMHGAEFEEKYFDTDVDECIKRDLNRGDKAVGEQVIRQMWRQFVEPVRAYAPDPSFKDAVIFDIDGTLARKGDRGHFDWDKVGFDLPVENVIRLANQFKRDGYYVFIFSGRDSVCREETEKWLVKHGVSYDELYMRPEGSMRKDAFIKEEFFEWHVKNRFNARFVVDDRLQVCRLWHTLGLTLLKVGDPDLEF